MEPRLKDGGSGQEGGSRTSLTGRTFLGMSWMLFGVLAQALTQLGVLWVLARLLEPEAFGLVQTVMLFIALFLAVGQAGLGPALVQRERIEDRHILTAFTLSVSCGLILALLTYSTAARLAGLLGNDALVPLLRVMSALFLLQTPSLAAEAVLQRDFRFRALSLVEVLSYLVGFGLVGLGVAFAGGGVWALVAAYLAQAAVRSLLLLILARHPCRFRIDFAAARSLLFFGGGFTAARIANEAALQGDKLVITATLGQVALGLYGRAYQLMLLPASLMGKIMSAVLFPAIASVQGDKTRLASAFSRGTVAIGLLVMPASAMAVLLGPELLRVVLGPGWEGAYLPFRLLAIGMYFRSAYKLSDTLARGTGRVYRRTWRQVVYALLVLSLAWLGHFAGLPGVAAGITTAITVNFLLMSHLALGVCEQPWRWFFRMHLAPLRVTCLVLAVAWPLRTLLISWAWPPLLRILGAVAVVLVVLWVSLRRCPDFFLGREGSWLLSRLPGPLGRPWRDRMTRSPAAD